MVVYLVCRTVPGTPKTVRLSDRRLHLGVVPSDGTMCRRHQIMLCVVLFEGAHIKKVSVKLPRAGFCAFCAAFDDRHATPADRRVGARARAGGRPGPHSARARPGAARCAARGSLSARLSHPRPTARASARGGAARPGETVRGGVPPSLGGGGAHLPPRPGRPSAALFFRGRAARAVDGDGANGGRAAARRGGAARGGGGARGGGRGGRGGHEAAAAALRGHQAGEVRRHREQRARCDVCPAEEGAERAQAKNPTPISSPRGEPCDLPPSPLRARSAATRAGQSLVARATRQRARWEGRQGRRNAPSVLGR